MRLSTRQGGAISRAQLHDLGLADHRVDHLVRRGWLIGEHRGVLRLGALTEDGVLWAAVLATGPESCVSHMSAAYLLGFTEGRRPREVHVTTPTPRRDRRGIRVHEARLDPRWERTTRRGIPVTAVARALLDIAATEPEAVLQAIVDEVRSHRKLSRRAVEATIRRAPGHHGIGALRRAAARHDPGRGMPRGRFERRARPFLRDRGFPPYIRNHPIEIDGEIFVPDVVWPAHRVWLELDSRGWHDNDPRFAEDRRRSRRLGAHGWHGVRATWQDFDERPDELAADLWAYLEAASTNPRPRG